MDIRITVIGASLSEPHTSVLMQKFGICMYVVVVRPAVNSIFAYHVIRMRSALHRYACGISRMEATGRFAGPISQGMSI